MPVPMIAPMPSSVRSKAVSVRLSAFAPCSTSPTSCSIDLVLKRFESIHPPGNHGQAAKRGDYTLNGRGWQRAHEAPRTRASIVGIHEQIGDDRDRGRAGGDHLRRARQRDAADRDDRLAAARGVRAPGRARAPRTRSSFVRGREDRTDGDVGRRRPASARSICSARVRRQADDRVVADDRRAPHRRRQVVLADVHAGRTGQRARRRHGR